MLTTESQIMNIRNTVWLIVFIGLGCLLFAHGANANPFDAFRKVNKDLNANDLIQEVENLLQNNENSIKVFDDYAFEKTRNLGIRIVTRSYEKTYNEKENTEILNMIVDKLTSKFNITLNEKGE